ncbi:MAG: hypothetical protein Q7S40_18010 [Opitutaceae bacterium]|nr:hypothetical protein [Opitutaceae bacterium]
MSTSTSPSRFAAQPVAAPLPGGASLVRPNAAVDPQNPWLGLASFTEEMREYFHGRDEDAAELARRVQRKTLTVLFGQSGHGKTSLLRAGLVPRLRGQGYCPVYVRLDYAPESPPPAEQIKAAIFNATLSAGTWTRTGSSVTGESLWEFLHHRDDMLNDAAGRPLVPLLIFDQFEEIFTLAQNDETGRQRAHAFLTQLADLVENRPPVELEKRIERDETDAAQFDFARADYRILIALREDYLAHLESLKSQMPSVTQNRVRLARFTGEQALAAVRTPAPHLVSDEVAAQIVRFVAGGADLARAEVEPSLLSLVCRELNNGRIARGQIEITADLLAGSRETILSEFYERALAGQPAIVRRFIEDELLTDSGYRESVAEERVKKAFAAAGAARDTLALLVGRRLLRVEERLDVRRVELTHDVLCSVVKASRDVRQERESREAIQRQLAETRLKEAETQQALWRARVVAVGCGILALAAIGSAVFGYTSMNRARAAEKIAQAAAERARGAAEEASGARRLTETARTQAEDLLGYVLTDLEEQLIAFGLLPMQLEVSQRAVAYYTGLPGELMTAQTRIAHGRALANLGAILDVQGESKLSRAHLERALGIFEELDQSGGLTATTRLDFASVLTRLARLSTSEGDFEGAVSLCDRAEKILGPPLADEVLRGRALRGLADVLERKGFSLLRSRRPGEAVPVYQRALASAEEGELLPPAPRRRGLQAASMMAWYGEALSRNHQPELAQQFTGLGRDRLRKFVEAEPALVAAWRQLAYATSQAGFYAAQQWDFGRVGAVREEHRDMYRQMLKLDPKNTTYLNNYAISYSGEAFGHRNRGDFVAAATALQEGLAILSTGSATNFMRANEAYGNAALAQVYAATGRDAEASQHKARMRAIVQSIVNERTMDSGTPALREEEFRSREREIEVERLNWPVVRAEAEQALARIEKMAARPADAEPIRELREDAALDLLQSNWAAGDYAAARKALTIWWASRPPVPDNPPIAARFGEVQSELIRVQTLARAGELTEARSILADIWVEVEAVFAAAPDETFNQVQYARALWVKAEVAERLSATERRALLERAAGHLRPLDAAGKLTRLQREMVLGGVDRALASLPGS